MRFHKIAFADPKLGSISSLRCQKSRNDAVHPDSACEVMFRGRYSLGQQSARLRSSSYAGHASINQDRLCHAKPKAKRGGARRDRTDDLMLAKHALSQLSYGPVPEDECRCRLRRMRSIKVVGLGRLELPTSRLSSARSNQLSYKPIARIISRSRTLRRPCLQPALQAGALMPKQPAPYGTSTSTQSLSMKEEKRRRRYPAFLSRSSCSEEAGDNLHKADCKWPSLERR